MACPGQIQSNQYRRYFIGIDRPELSFITLPRKSTFESNQRCFYMTIYEAIAEMRRLSKLNRSFSFSFYSYSLSRNHTSGIVTVHNARLRKRGRVEDNQYAELQEEYMNLDTMEPRKFWHCCLQSLNGQSLTFTTSEDGQ